MKKTLLVVPALAVLLAGCSLTGSNDVWGVMDAKGNTAKITIADVMSSNGVTFVVDSVLMS
jgi:hypothetical protein